jgi:hypothetical protein
VLRPGGMLAACAPNRNSTPELAHILPGWGEPSTFDGEDAADLIASVFSEPGDQVAPDRWDGPLVTLSAAEHAAGFLRLHGMTESAAQAAAAGLDLPLTLTMRGCCVYATRAGADVGASALSQGPRWLRDRRDRLLTTPSTTE